MSTSTPTHIIKSTFIEVLKVQCQYRLNSALTVDEHRPFSLQPSRISQMIVTDCSRGLKETLFLHRLHTYCCYKSKLPSDTLSRVNASIINN